MIIGLLAIATRSAIVLLWLFAGVRITGRKHLAQMNIADLAMLMLIANAVQNAMTMGKGNFSVGAVSALTLMLVGYGITRLLLKRQDAERLLIGVPVTLIYNGKVNWRLADREQVTEDDLNAAFREHQLEKASEVRLAVLEVDGSISVVPKKHHI
ncbi:MAG: DUF421 domain-containing protein [Armatimonadetes bacterium]|nr:DUF421 domain-containing protein [Armatimonadota bacterium]